MAKEYAVYDKNDNVLVVGNTRECSKYLGIRTDSFKSEKSRQKTGKSARKKYLIVEIEEDEEVVG